MNPLEQAIDTILLPPRLTIRALDDLHELATAVGDMNRRLTALERSVEEIASRLDLVVTLGRELEKHSGELATGGRAMARGAKELADRSAEVAAAVPVLQEFVKLAAPLEGALRSLTRRGTSG